MKKTIAKRSLFCVRLRKFMSYLFTKKQQEEATNSIKAQVRAASTIEINLSNPVASLDGVSLTEGDRVLIKDQVSDATENGLYVVNSSSILERADDANLSEKVKSGFLVAVTEGTQATTVWILATSDPITLGGTTLTFEKSGVNDYVIKTGDTMTGDLQFDKGAGVAASVQTVDRTIVGEAAGAMSLQGGTGGAGNIGSPNGGAGGSVSITSGAGGIPYNTNEGSSQGGALHLIAGLSKGSTAGGEATLTGGAGGSGFFGGESTLAGDGGSVTISGGAPGALGTTGSTSGGNVNLNGGTLASGAAPATGGSIYVSAGDGYLAGDGGAVNFNAGDGNTGNAGSILVQAGASNALSGGAVTVQGGACLGSGVTQAGGALTVQGGSGSPALSTVGIGGAGGQLTLSGGSGGNGNVNDASGAGGNVLLQGGAPGLPDDGASGKGGDVSILGGQPNSSGSGGDITITGGELPSATVCVGAIGRTGGAVTISGGKTDRSEQPSGSVSISGGQGLDGDATFSPSRGGDVSITAGAGGDDPNLLAGEPQAGGSVTIIGGASGTGGTSGNAVMRAGAGAHSTATVPPVIGGDSWLYSGSGGNGNTTYAGASGGDINILAADGGGAAGAQTPGSGGAVNITGGNHGLGGNNGGAGGDVNLTGGEGVTTAGKVTILGGKGPNNAGNIQGGQVSLQGGQGSTNTASNAGLGGNTYATGGAGGSASGTYNAGDGGALNLKGGLGGDTGTGTRGNGGHVYISGGNSGETGTGGGLGGDVQIDGGFGEVTSGTVLVGTTTNTTALTLGRDALPALTVGGTQLATTGSQPTADSGSRGLLWDVQGGVGVADSLQAVIKNSGDTYEWKTLSFTDTAPASHASGHLSGGVDEVDGDQLDIDWNPTNYTPTTSPAEATSVDHLTAHLAGIDAILSLVLNPSAGEMYEKTIGTPTTITLTSLGVFYPWISATNGTTTGSTYVTFNNDDTNGDYLAVGADGAGTYDIEVSVSFDGSASTKIVGSVFNNSTETHISFSRVLGASGEVDNVSATGRLVLAANDQIRLKFTCPDTNTKQVGIEVCNVKIKRIA